MYLSNFINELIEDNLVQGSKANGRDLVAVAKDYLAKIDTIRILVADGPGFGSHASPIYIMDYMRRVLGFQGVFEIIAEDIDRESRRKSMRTELLPINKIAILLGLSWENITLTKELPDIGKVRLRGLSDFISKGKGPEAKVKLGIFVGVTEDLIHDYKGVGKPGIFFRVSAPGIANSQKVAIFNPYTQTVFHSPFYIDPGFSLQLEGQAPVSYLRARLLPYLPPKPSLHAVTAALSHLQMTKPFCAASIEVLLHKLPKLSTFAIYGLNPLLHKHPEYSLLNLVIAGAKVAQEEGVSLVIPLLNTISNASWKQLQNSVSNANIPALNQALAALYSTLKIVFIDTERKALSLQKTTATTVYVVRSCALPKALFDKLFTESTYPPVYEGTNAASSLLSVGKYGLHCAVKGRLMQEPGLPWDLQKTSVCTDLSPEVVWGKADQSPVNNTIALIKKYQDPHVIRSTPEVERISYALSELYEAPECSEVWLLECGISHAAVIWGKTLVSGVAYGIYNQFLCSLLRFFGSFSRPVAESLANIILLGTIALVENDSVSAAAYQMVAATIFHHFIGFTFLQREDRKLFNSLFMGSFLLFNALINLRSEDPQSILWSLIMIVSSMESRSYGRMLGEKLEARIGNLYNTARTGLNEAIFGLDFEPNEAPAP